MNKMPLQLAMIGCGGYAGYLIDRLAELPGECRLVAVTTRNPDSKVAQALKVQGVAVYKNVNEMLRVLSPDECPAVIVPTSIESHFQFTKQLIDHGFHILLEKPPVATIQDLDRLIELQHSSGKWISVNFQFLYNPMTQALKTRLRSGEFGNVLSVNARALWTRPESYFSRSDWSGFLQLDGRWVLDGTIGNPLAHLLAEALYLATTEAGMAEPANVQAELYHANNIESEDTSCLRLKTTEGVPILYFASLCSQKTHPVWCEIKTEKAVIQLFDYRRIEIKWHDRLVEKDEISNDDIHLDRRIMLKSVIEKLAKNEKPLVTVEECRPFLLAWNGAFESFGLPHSIPVGVTYESKDPSGAVRCIRGLDEMAATFFATGRMFSSNGEEWARTATQVTLNEYDYFPSINSFLIDCERGFKEVSPENYA